MGTVQNGNFVSDYTGTEIDAFLAMVEAANAIGSAGVAPNGFGLGMESAPAVTDLNNVSASGFYRFGSSALHSPIGSSGMLLDIHYATNYATQFAFTQNTEHTIWRRQKVNVQWGNATAAWECVNPPMSIGSEYLTTERFLGKPVYALATTVDVASDYASWGSTLYPKLNGSAIVVENLVSAKAYYTMNSALAPIPSVERGATMGTEANGVNFGISSNRTVLFRVGFGNNASYTLKGKTLTVCLKYTKTS